MRFGLVALCATRLAESGHCEQAQGTLVRLAKSLADQGRSCRSVRKTTATSSIDCGPNGHAAISYYLNCNTFSDIPEVLGWPARGNAPYVDVPDFACCART